MINAAYYNGRITTIDEMTIPINDRAIYFGDGVYEAAYLKNRKILALADHIERFYSSCRLLKIDFTMEKSKLAEILTSLTALLDSDDDGIIYWQASRGTAPRNHLFPENTTPNLLAYVKNKPLPDTTTPIKIISLEDKRYGYCHIKTLNLVPNILAMQEAYEKGCDEAVLHINGNVTECAHSSIYIIKDGVLITAPLSDNILPGTVRKQLLQICRELAIPYVETGFTLSDIHAADEVFITSATALIRRVCELDGRPVGGHASEILAKLCAAYLELIDRELN